MSKVYSIQYLNHREKRHFAVKVLQSKQGTCPLLVFACLPNERSLLRSINKVKCHQV